VKKLSTILLYLPIVTLALLAIVVTSAGFSGETPAGVSGTTRVDAARAKALMGIGAVMVDVRLANEASEAHIQDATNIPYTEKSPKAMSYDASQDSFDISRLPADKNAAIILAGNGPDCWASYKAARAAVQAGYRRVYWFRGGFPEWKSAGYPLE
jgi:rhodanese-related sulfurtransferase